MFATLLLILSVTTIVGDVQVFVKLPMADMATCEAWLRDPAAIVVYGGSGKTAVCVDAPTEPGKPV